MAQMNDRTLDLVDLGAAFAGMYMLHRLSAIGLRACARGRQRRRRHLVLEPLSGG
jgi:hypothetical protein